MTTMNSDECGRLEQIREGNQPWRQTAYEIADVLNGYTSDIDFLLSLVDSQPIGWISCGLRHGSDRIVDIVFENADCAKAFIDGIEPAVGPIVAATRMRDLCVEKVRERYDQRVKDLHALSSSDNHEDEANYERAVLFVLGSVIKDLESLTLDQVEKKQ